MQLFSSKAVDDHGMVYEELLPLAPIPIPTLILQRVYISIPRLLKVQGE